MAIFINTEFDDALTGTANNDTFFLELLGTGFDLFHGLGGTDMLQGGAGNDTLFGGTGDDQLFGGSGTNRLYGGLGDDVIATNETQNGLTGTEQIFGGAGFDTLDLGLSITGVTVSFNTQTAGASHFLGIEAVSGSNFDDMVTCNTAPIQAALGGGADIFIGGTGRDTAFCGNGDDLIRGLGGDDSLFGDGANDRLYGGNGNDILNDSFSTTGFVDKIYGGSGTDLVILGSTGNGRIDGGTGTDTLEFQNFGSQIALDIDLSVGVNVVDLGPGGIIRITNFENVTTVSGHCIVRGSSGDNVIQTGVLDDTIYGGGGNDTVNGELDRDELFGGAGADQMNGSWGADFLTGGAGGDASVFTDRDESPAFAADTVVDFLSGSDKIDLQNFGYYDVALTRFVPVTFAFVGGGAFSGITADLRFTVIAGLGVLLEGDSDHDGSADFAVNLTGLATLAVTDLLL